MTPDHRRQRILSLLESRAGIEVNQVAAELAVSRETVRRDLAVLERGGYLNKVHGGAVPVQTGTEPALSQRVLRHRTEKRRIAERAAQLFETGDSLFIDAGTTTAAFAAALVRVARGLTVITNSLEVARQIGRSSTGPRVWLLGGEFRADGLETVGPLTVDQIGQFRTDHAVLTVGAVNAGGIYDFNAEEAVIARTMIAHAARTTVLADRSKLGGTALIKVTDLRAVGRLVTDAAPPEDLALALATAGTELVIATELVAPEAAQPV